jgi:hypothetical protein
MTGSVACDDLTFISCLMALKRSVTRFKRCSCYEIGGDVFSLAELECKELFSPDSLY